MNRGDAMDAISTHEKTKQHTPSAEHLLELLPTGIVVINAQGIIVRANQAAAKLLGISLLNRVWIEVIAEAFSPREDDGHEISLKDGRRVNITLCSLESAPGEMIVITDITMTRAFEQAKSQQQRLLEMGKMTAHLAHQIRTPLASAMIYADHLTNLKLSETKRLDCIKKIKSSHNNIEQQIRDLLLFAGGGNSLVEPSLVQALMDKAVSQAQAVLMQREVKLSVDNQVGLVSFSAHIESLIGAIVNLIDNAVKAQAKTIQFKTVLQNQQLHFIVSDDGIGIDEDTLQHILVPFFTTRAKGTGLGLAVVNAVARNHGGHLSVNSSLGQGSCFDLAIPFIQFNRREKS